MPNINNTYIPGAGVGASSIANRRAKMIRSTNCTDVYPCNRFFSRLGLHNYVPTPTPPDTVPDPPTNLIVTYISGTTYTVTFNTSTNNGGSQITGYKLNYTDSNDTNYNINNISSGDNIQLTVPSTYTFILTATNVVGTSIPSTPPFIIIVYPPSVPDPPTNVTLTNISPDVVGVVFNSPINTGGSSILSYTITCTAVGRPDIIIAPITTTSLSNQITLPQGVSYTITVIATNIIGDSSTSSTSTPSSITPISNPNPTITQFTTSGPTTWTAPATVTSISYLVVGGGAGGGGAYDNSAGGGGGAGLVLTGTMDVTPGQTYNITVGTGGAGATRPSYSNPAGQANNNNGSSGNSSSFDLIVAGGGGFGYKSRTGAGPPTPYGGSKASGFTPPTGGSGGDGGGDGGGGGGNGSAGTALGQGGSGITSNITGSIITYGRGGNGGSNGSNSPGTSGQVNTGNGGQGGGSLSFNNMGGSAGGSGIIVINFYT